MLPGFLGAEAKKLPQNGKAHLQLESPNAKNSSLKLPVAGLPANSPSGESNASFRHYAIDSPSSTCHHDGENWETTLRRVRMRLPTKWSRVHGTATLAFMSHLLILVGMAACDILHSVENGQGEAFFALPLVIVYGMLAVLLCLSARFARRLTCRCPLWPGLATMQLAVVFLSSAWRQDLQPEALGQGDRFSGLGAFVQILVLFLYPVCRTAAAVFSLSTMALLIVLKHVLQQSDVLISVGNIVMLACVGIVCMVMSYADCDPVASGVPPVVRSDMTSRLTQSVFEPLLDGDVHSSPTRPSIETKLQRLVKQLLETKGRIDECGGLESELSEVLRNVLDTIVHQMDSSNIFRVALSDASHRGSTALNNFLKETFDPQATPADWINRHSSPPGQEATHEDTTDVPSVVNMVEDKIPILAEAVRITPMNSRSISKSIATAEDPEMRSMRDRERELATDFECQCQDGHHRDYDRAVSYMVGCLRYPEKAPPETDVSPSDELVTLRLDRLAKWDFDIPEFATKCENLPLVLVAIAGSGYYVKELRLSEERVGAFFRNVAVRYHASNPYHNCMHGADVLNDMLYFLSLRQDIIQRVSNLEKFAALVACAAHDVGHNGKANRYHMMVASPLSLLYNDKSCLENMSCSMLFAILQMEACNFSVDLDTASKATLRSFVVSMILETDLAQHMQVVAAFRQHFLPADADTERRPPEFESLSTQDRKQVLALILKFCDVGHSAKPFALHTKWSLRITAEFFAQGDSERALSMPCSPFCDRTGTDISESQRGFFDFIVTPLSAALDEFLVCSQLRMEVFADLHRNQKFWKNYTGTDFNYEDAKSNYATLQMAFVDICRSLHGRRNSSYSSLNRLVDAADKSGSHRTADSSIGSNGFNNGIGPLRSGAYAGGKPGVQIQPKPPATSRRASVQH